MTPVRSNSQFEFLSPLISSHLVVYSVRFVSNNQCRGQCKCFSNPVAEASKCLDFLGKGAFVRSLTPQFRVYFRLIGTR